VRVVGKPEVIQLDEKSRYRRSDSTFLPYTSQLAGYSEAEQYGTTRAGALAGSEVTVSSCVPPSIPEATISGYCQGVEYSGSVENVFEWITMDGPTRNIEPGFARIEIIETIAIVHLESAALVRETRGHQCSCLRRVHFAQSERRVEDYS